MRLTRVYVDAGLATGMALPLPPGPARHLVRVLRLEAGAPLILFNGQGGEFEGAIESVQRDRVSVRVGSHQAIERESPLRVTLLQGIARGEKMDLILQKATELGAAAFVPVTMARSTVRLDARNSAAKQAHWQSVVISACEQCGRNTLPPVLGAVTLGEALTADRPGLRLLLSPDAGTAPLSRRLEAHPGKPVTLLVGPEGGFDPAEAAAALAAGFHPCRLGPRILRTETAGLAALAALQTLAGDLR